MRKKGDVKDLNHFLNTHKINNNGDDNVQSRSGILQQLEGVTNQRVDEIDYHQQIERWNRYQDLLDEVDKRCSRDIGVRLVRNVRHNVKVFSDISVAGLSIIALIASISLGGSFSINSIPGIVGSIAALGFIGWQILIRLHHPSIIHFKCSPVLHIDEFAYMRQAIKAIPTPEHDPIVRLPVLEMSIPRIWLAQQGMLRIMESLSDINLDKRDQGNKNDVSSGWSKTGSGRINQM
jgi:hypothetical protein